MFFMEYLIQGYPINKTKVLFWDRRDNLYGYPNNKRKGSAEDEMATEKLNLRNYARCEWKCME